MREDFTYPSKDGKIQIHAIRWTPDEGEIKAVLQITHGMIEHIERYEPFALYLEAAFIYLIFSTALTWLQRYLEQKLVWKSSDKKK